MTGWWEILVVAFVTQLAVLPGEKVQFIIAGLSTYFDPKVVVVAASSAFTIWTALEILLGQALKNALSPAVLDAITAVLFATFAVLLYRSASDTSAESGAATTDGGVSGLDDMPTVLGRELSTQGFGGFLPIFAMMAANGFGDKTQLVTIGLAVQYGATSAIWTDEMFAIIPVSIANVYFFHRFSHRFDARKAYLGAAGLFAFFAADALLSLATGFSVWETLVGTASDAVLALF